mmetsp:Transcript_1958/g.4356  ORF Transcript_1958/g.4356 Transcript_1958/m.4356 type:complete len:155 (+) Transcript_1958:218-682(+)
MSDLKKEWPYILHSTSEERKNYESDLPENLEALKVRPIAPTYRWRLMKVYDRRDYLYITPEEANEIMKLNYRTAVGDTLFFIILGLGISSMNYRYKMDLHANFVAFKNESWVSYVKTRFWPSLGLGLTFLFTATDLHPKDLPGVDSVARVLTGE